MVEPAARRLLVASALRLHVARRLGPAPLPTDLDADGLRDAAARLHTDGDDLAGTHRLRCEPAYPGATAGVEEVRNGRRLVLTCAVAHAGEPAAVVVTTLVPGRAPQVSAVPPHTPAPSPG